MPKKMEIGKSQNGTRGDQKKSGGQGGAEKYGLRDSRPTMEAIGA